MASPVWFRTVSAAQGLSIGWEFAFTLVLTSWRGIACLDTHNCAYI